MLRYAVIGNPITQSWSPFIHQQFSKQTDIALSYEAVQVEAANKSAFQTILQQLSKKYAGINITLPYKRWAFEVLKTHHRLSDRAKDAGTVNCITFANANVWLGDNTDGIGLVRDISQNLGWHLQGCKILMLGAGGAAQAVLPAMIETNPICIDVLNRDLSKAKAMIEPFKGAHCEMHCLDSCGKISYDCIINATSASLWKELPSTIDTLHAENTYCYDMVYSASPTVFLQWAISQHAKATSDGLGMLVEQAAESFYQWHAVMPDTKIVIEQLRNQLF